MEEDKIIVGNWGSREELIRNMKEKRIKVKCIYASITGIWSNVCNYWFIGSSISCEEEMKQQGCLRGGEVRALKEG